jgi:hypothetical protein
MNVFNLTAVSWDGNVSIYKIVASNKAERVVIKL